MIAKKAITIKGLPYMSNPLENLLSVIDLERLTASRFRGLSGTSLWRRVFGGHVMAQALEAAQRTVEIDRHVHSFHCYFLQPGNPDSSIDYDVELMRDGRSFSVRHVKAMQRNKVIFSLTASFHIEEPGYEFQRPMCNGIQTPEEILEKTGTEEKISAHAPGFVHSYANQHRSFIILPLDVDNYIHRTDRKSKQKTWFKLNGTIKNDRRLRSVILAYMSDMTLLDTALYPHGQSIISPTIMPASLDHAMWFHRQPNFDDWLLYDCVSPNSSGARGLSQGFIYNRSGELVATTCQEGLLRPVNDASQTP